MNEIITVNYDNKKPIVSGRDLHNALYIKTPYDKWFPRMCEYGFSEETDFSTFLSESTGGRPATDHQLTISMAKELCMIQRTDIGRRFRQYFIEVENAWNTPEAVMARALKMANTKIDTLGTTVKVQEQQIAELQPKASYYDLVLNCPDLLSVTKIAKDFGKTANWLNSFLYEKGVQFKQGGIWLLYEKYARKGYTSTKTHTVSGNDGRQHSRVHTYWTQKGRLFIYELLKSNGVLPIVERDKSA